jgi:small subunit ribosomal protein S3Ae
VLKIQTEENMAKQDKKKVSRIKTKKKSWFKVMAPPLFANKAIGEMYLPAAEIGLNRVLTTNLKDLTGNVKDQNAYIGFKITNADSSVLHTTTIGYRLTAAYVKRVVRKNADRLDDYYVLKTKDGQEVVIKTLLLTRSKSPRSTRSSIRSELKSLLQEELQKGDFSYFVSNIVHYKVQGGIKRKLSKITPVKEVAIRVLALHGKTIQLKKAPLKVVPKETTEISKESNSEAAEISKPIPETSEV